MKNHTTIVLLLGAAACGLEQEVGPVDTSSGSAGTGGMTTTTSVSGGNGGSYSQGGYGGAVGGAAMGGYGGSDICDDLSGKFRTYSQGGWNNQVELLSTLMGDGVLIGKADADYTSFTAVDAVTAFLPAGGIPGALQGQYLNPLTTPAGVLAGQTLTLKLNAAIGDEACGYTLADLVMVDGDCEGMSVSEVLESADRALSGAETALSYSALNECAKAVNQNFDYGENNNHLRFP